MIYQLHITIFQIIWVIINGENPIKMWGSILLTIISFILCLFKDTNIIIMWLYWVTVIIQIMLSIMDSDYVGLLMVVLSTI